MIQRKAKHQFVLDVYYLSCKHYLVKRAFGY